MVALFGVFITRCIGTFLMFFELTIELLLLYFHGVQIHVDFAHQVHCLYVQKFSIKKCKMNEVVLILKDCLGKADLPSVVFVVSHSLYLTLVNNFG